MNLYSIKSKGLNNHYVDIVDGKIIFSCNDFPLFDEISAGHIANLCNAITTGTPDFWKKSLQATDTVANYIKRKK